MNSIDRLKKVKELLFLEREEDFYQYKEQFLRASIEQRKKNGATWFPIQILSDELGYADYVHVEIERTNNLDTPHQFSAGKNVSLFSNKNQDEVQEITGTIKHSSKNKMKIILHTDELPDWCYEGRLGELWMKLLEQNIIELLNYAILLKEQNYLLLKKWMSK